MNAQHAEGWTRRRFPGGVTVAGAAGLLGLNARPVAAFAGVSYLMGLPSFADPPLGLACA